jgi:thymidylate synthase ThyX
MKGTIHKDLQIATVRSESTWNKFKVHTLLQNINQKQPSINAYLGARYSRSSDSITEIAKEIIVNDTDAAARLEAIFHGYGHKSVGDMAELFVCIENIPMYSAMKIFYLNSVIAGQERSTRYQNFESPEFIKIPKELCSDDSLRKEYDRIMLKQMSDYRKLLKKTREVLHKQFKINDDNKDEVNAWKARSFDTARYLLPYGLQTSLAAVMSARNWSELIAYFNAGDSVVENEIADLLMNLLGESKLDINGYIREADVLIRHTDANCCRRNSTLKILDYLKEKVSKQKEFELEESESSSVKLSYNTDFVEDLITHYELLINPLGSSKDLEFDYEDQISFGEKIFEYHNQHNLLGNIGQSGAVKIDGFATLGTLKDLNRHRSMERYIPLFHDQINIDNELEREDKECYFLCNYLDIKEIKDLKKDYQKALNETYSMIKNWRKVSKNFVAQEVSVEYTKYLLPHAHATRYNFYGSFDDLQYTINLRLRRGGHIAYRALVYKWLEELALKDNIWKYLLRNSEKPDPKSKEQFVDRS